MPWEHLGFVWLGEGSQILWLHSQHQEQARPRGGEASGAGGAVQGERLATKGPFRVGQWPQGWRGELGAQ